MKDSLGNTLQLISSWHTIESPFHQLMKANCPIDDWWHSHFVDNMSINLDQFCDVLVDYLHNEE